MPTGRMAALVIAMSLGVGAGVGVLAARVTSPIAPPAPAEVRAGDEWRSPRPAPPPPDGPKPATQPVPESRRPRIHGDLEAWPSRSAALDDARTRLAAAEQAARAFVTSPTSDSFLECQAALRRLSDAPVGSMSGESVAALALQLANADVAISHSPDPRVSAREFAAALHRSLVEAISASCSRVATDAQLSEFLRAARQMPEEVYAWALAGVVRSFEERDVVVNALLDGASAAHAGALRLVAIESLERVAPRRNTPVLAELLRGATDGTAAVAERAAAWSAMVNFFPTDECFSAAVHAANDPATPTGVRDAAMRLIARCGDARWRRVLFDLESGATEGEIRDAARRALGG